MPIYLPRYQSIAQFKYSMLENPTSPCLEMKALSKTIKVTLLIGNGTAVG